MQIAIDRICYDVFADGWFTAGQLVDALPDYHHLIARRMHYMTEKQLSAILRGNKNIEVMHGGNITFFRVIHMTGELKR